MSRNALLGAIISMGADAAWAPSDLGTAVSWWDMVESTITKSGANVTQIDDLIGSNDLVDGAANPPLDVTSDTDLGRRAVQHDSANTESMGVSVSSESQPLTLWMIGTLDTITPSAGFSGLIGGGIFDAALRDSTPDTFEVYDGTTSSASTSPTPAADTPYLFVYVVNGTSTRLYINNTDSGVSPGSFSTAAIATVLIGDDTTSDYSDITWTSAGLTGEAMTSGDRTSLYTWAQDNCNV